MATGDALAKEVLVPPRKMEAALAWMGALPRVAAATPGSNRAALEDPEIRRRVPATAPTRAVPETVLPATDQTGLAEGVAARVPRGLAVRTGPGTVAWLTRRGDPGLLDSS